MIKCFCIDDKNRPADFPLSKWVKESQPYHITYATIVLPQKVLAFQLHEIELDETCLPYKYFQSTRFVIHEDDIEAMEQLILNSMEADRFFNDVMNIT